MIHHPTHLFLKYAKGQFIGENDAYMKKIKIYRTYTVSYDAYISYDAYMKKIKISYDAYIKKDKNLPYLYCLHMSYLEIQSFLFSLTSSVTFPKN